MKKVFILAFMLFSIIAYSQSKKDFNKLSNRIDSIASETKILKSENDFLKSKIIEIESYVKSLNDSLTTLNFNKQLSAKNDTIKSDNKQIVQCKALTQSGTQCKRNSNAGSDYCWQHQDNVNKSSQTQSTPTTKSSGSSSSGSKSIQTGSRGGQYYINKNGNKTYVKKK